MKFVLIILFIGLFFGLSQAAQRERGFTVMYEEPTNTTTLAGTRIYMDIIGDGLPGWVDTMPPTSKTGGGTVSKTYCVTIPDATATRIPERFEIQATAFNEAGEESPKTPIVTWPIDGTPDCSGPISTPLNLRVINKKE